MAKTIAHAKWQNYANSKTPVAEPKSEKPSKTLPDQALTIRQILERHTRGQEINELFKPLYEFETEAEELFDHLPDVEKMSTIQRAQYAKEVGEFAEELQQKILDNDIKIVPPVEDEPSPPPPTGEGEEPKP